MSDITEAEEIAAVMAGIYVWDKHCARKGADTNRAARLWSRGPLVAVVAIFLRRLEVGLVTGHS